MCAQIAVEVETMKKSVNRIRRVRFHIIVSILVCGIALITTGLIHAEDLEISPMSYDYGDVALGESRTATFLFESQGSSDVSVYLLRLNETTAHDSPYADPSPPGNGMYCLGSFCFTSGTYPSLPTVLPPGEHFTFDVIFTPLSLGEQSAYLYNRCNDTYPPPGVISYLPLEGTGVASAVPEPATMLLLGSGLLSLWGFRKKFQK